MNNSVHMKHNCDIFYTKKNVYLLALMATINLIMIREHVDNVINLVKLVTDQEIKTVKHVKVTFLCIFLKLSI